MDGPKVHTDLLDSGVVEISTFDIARQTGPVEGATKFPEIGDGDAVVAI